MCFRRVWWYVSWCQFMIKGAVSTIPSKALDNRVYYFNSSASSALKQSPLMGCHSARYFAIEIMFRRPFWMGRIKTRLEPNPLHVDK